MKARILQSLNAPGLIIMGLLFLTLQSTLFLNPSIAFFQPDTFLLLVLWVAMHRSFYEGGILTLILAYCLEIHSASPSGVFLCTFMGIFLIARFLYRHFQVVNKRTLVIVAMVTSVLSRSITLFVLYLMNKADNQWFHTLQLIPPTAIVHGLLVIPLYKLLHRFDLWTLKHPDAEHRYERDFYLEDDLF